MPWPAPSEEQLYRTVLPEHYQALARPLGVEGTVVVEASSWVEDNQWILDLAKDDPFRSEDLAAINKRYADLRSFLAKTQFAVEVDETQGLIRRLEMGGQYVSFSKSCTWSTRYKRDICRNVTRTTYRYALGSSYMKDTGTPVTDEPNAMPIKDLMEKLMPTPVEPTSTEPLPTEPSTTESEY